MWSMYLCARSVVGVCRTNSASYRTTSNIPLDFFVALCCCCCAVAQVQHKFSNITISLIHIFSLRKRKWWVLKLVKKQYLESDGNSAEYDISSSNRCYLSIQISI